MEFFEYPTNTCPIASKAESITPLYQGDIVAGLVLQLDKSNASDIKNQCSSCEFKDTRCINRYNSNRINYSWLGPLIIGQHIKDTIEVSGWALTGEDSIDFQNKDGVIYSLEGLPDEQYSFDEP